MMNKGGEIYFNPHSRKGSDVLDSGMAVFTGIISIHTPARGVTLLGKNIAIVTFISIHTPARGVTS